VYERKRDDGKDIYSLPLETEIQKHSDAKHYVVVSVGGNDFRNPLLLSPWNFLHKISTVQSNYLQILGQVQAIQGRNVVPILMFQYRTNFQDDGYKIYATFKRFGLVMAKLNICAMGLIGYAAYSWCAGKVSRTVGLGGVFLGGVFLYLSHRQLSIRFMVDMVTEDTGLVVFQTLLNRFYAPIIARAGRDQIPIIQSNETLDPNRSEHYINSIEPSEEGGKVIAQKIAEVIRSNLTKG
jgi:multisubunit Na+/H+ antiporter MnhG subunit